MVLFIVASVSGGGSTTSQSTTVPTADSGAPEMTNPPTPSGPVTSFGPGTYVVGTDIVAGTYKTAGSASDSPCYWARLRNTSGELSAIITNGNPEGPTTVTISKSDGAFETSGCQQWHKIG